MSMVDFADWKNFWCKFKWQFISFKFLSFWTFIILLIVAGMSLFKIFMVSVAFSKELYTLGFIEKKNVAELIMHSQTVLFDTALSHILLFFGAVIGSIIAIKGVSYWTNSTQKTATIKAITKENIDLKAFLPKDSIKPSIEDKEKQ